MGARSRYGPFIWQTVSGGIQYIGGNVNITNGTLTVSGTSTLTGNVMVDADTFYSLKTVIKTISIDDDASTDDFQFDDDQTNTTEQKVNLGNLIPAYGELVSAQLRCLETVDDGSPAVMAIDLGTATGGAEIFATADIDSANDISATEATGGPEIVATAAAKAVWINATPAVNWNTLLTGRWSVMITYIDYGAVHTAGIP
jgi:hypothetical protein